VNLSAFGGGIAVLLREKAGDEPHSKEERFVAACAAGDAGAAQDITGRRSDPPGALSPTQLRLLPELAAEGANTAAMLMVSLGWPIAVRGGDWDASALNLAVFRGDAVSVGFLLDHGARWTEAHRFGDNVCSTLS
jgi:hypothetical protein